MVSNRIAQRIVMAAALAVPMVTLAVPEAHAGIAIGISVNFGPPALPVYVQPPLPAPGYLWNPGYWAYGPAGYYWVPGVWVQPPSPGLLWTPPYWGFAGGVYGFHAGYWGPHVGFYGGVNYGFGFGGIGFSGGEWRGGGFFYNSAAANFGGTHVTNVYENRTIVNNTTIINNNHTSYNGGPGGINRTASVGEQQAANENHIQPTQNQTQHQNFAAQDRSQLASVNNGRPSTTAVPNNGAYRQVAQQHAQTQPITQTDRAQGRAYQPNGREANQDQRIANGLKTGQMTSGEAARATAQQSRIDSQVSADRAANGGRLTNQQRQQVNNEQNRASQNIYNDNHNANTIRPNAVDNREANQQQRMANGLRSGQTTSAEAGRANNNQAYTDQQVHNDRTANGGTLNGQQRQQINRQQNANSQQVYNQNHNNQTHAAPPAKPQGLPHEAPGSGGARPQAQPHEAPGSGGERKR